MRPVFVLGEPDLLGPAVKVRLAGAAVRHGVAHLDLVALEGLRRRLDRVHDQVGEGPGVDIDRQQLGVVAVVGPLVHGAALVGDDDRVHRAAEALGHLEGPGQRQVLLARRQRGAVGNRTDQDVVVGHLVVQRQVDAVGPVGHVGRHRPLVDHRERHRRRAARVHHRRTRDQRNLQVRARQHGHRDLCVVQRSVIAFCRSLVHRVARVRDDQDLVVVAGVRGQNHLLAPRVREARQQRTLVAVAANRRAGAGLARLAQVDRVGPGAGRVALALVQHAPRDVDGRAFGRMGRADDVAHDQIGRRRERHRERRRDAAVVVRVDELERPTGLNDHVVIARDPLGQRHGAGARVAAVGRQEADVVEIVQKDRAAAVGVGRQVDTVAPVVGTGQAYALVAHDPGDVERAPAHGVADRRHAVDHQVGVRNRHDVERRRVGGRVVRLPAVLEHLAIDVGAHEQRVAALERRRQVEGLTARIAVAHGQGAAVRVARQHDVVAVADDGVARSDDGVGPIQGLSDPVALVRHRPGHRDLRRVVDRQVRRDDAAHGQVGVGRQVNGQPRAGGVVALGVEFGDLPGRVAHDDDPVTSGGVDRQHESAALGVAGSRCQRAADVAAQQQRVPGANDAVARQVDAVAPTARDGAAAGVAHVPRQRHQFARGGARSDMDRISLQVRVHDLQACGRGQLVVALEWRLIDLVAGVGHDQQAVAAVGQVRQREVQGLRIARARRQRAPARHRPHLHGVGQSAAAAQVDAVGPGAGGRCVAEVLHGPARAARLSWDASGGQLDGSHAQVGHGRRAQRRRARGGQRVVAFGAGFIHQIAGVGLDQEMVVAAQAVRCEQVRQLRVAGAHRERSAVGHFGQQRVRSVEHRIAGQVDRIGPAADVAGGVAVVAHAPGQRDGLAPARCNRCVDHVDAQVGVWRRDRDANRRGGVVGPCVGFEHRGMDVGHHGQVEASVEEHRQRQHLAHVVGRAGVEHGAARHVGQCHVVGIADHGVATQHDPVDPAARRRHAALVAHGPAHTDDLATASGQRRREVADHQVRVGVGGGAEFDAGAVVALCGSAAGRVLDQAALARGVLVAEHLHFDAPGAAQPVGQPEGVGSREAAVRLQRGIARERDVVEQRRVQQFLVRVQVAHDDAIVPARRRRRQPQVDVIPGHRDVAACGRCGRTDLQVAHLQVGR